MVCGNVKVKLMGAGQRCGGEAFAWNGVWSFACLILCPSQPLLPLLHCREQEFLTTLLSLAGDSGTKEETDQSISSPALCSTSSRLAFFHGSGYHCQPSLLVVQALTGHSC